MRNKTGLYIHIPFCRSKCAYCDFLSASDYNADITAQYVQALLAELRHARLGDMQNQVVETIYIGGGTPTALDASFLCKIIKEARQFRITEDAEITVEVNPGGAEPYFSELQKAGVNRLSIGLQAWQDGLLARIGRTHTQRDFIETFQAARAAGFDNINVDLMFALPGQTMEDWQESLAQVIALKPEHLSAYSLTPAENTPLWDALERGQIILPDEETDREMYYAANRILSAAGYTRYEISNYAQPNRESRHNLNTWLRRLYRGFGLGAHSFEEKNNNGTRRHNTENMETYLSEPPLCMNVTNLTPEEALSESIILGLRLTQGIEYTPAIRARYAAQINKLIKNNLLAHIKTTNRLTLTPRGTDLANQVFTEFI